MGACTERELRASPAGLAIMLARERTDWCFAGPISTRLLPGEAHYRRVDEKPHRQPDG